MTYGEGCDQCGEHEPGTIYVNEDNALCGPCYRELKEEEAT